MNYPDDLYEQARRTLANRRQAALLKWERDRKKLPLEYPDIVSRQDKLNTMQLQIAKKALAGADTARVRAELRTASDELDKSITSANVPPEYLAPQYHCPVCQDRGFVKGQRCRCLAELLNQMVYKQLSDSSAAVSCRFDNFDVLLYSPNDRLRMDKVLRSCRRYANEFEAKKAKNLLFWGGTGLGKTHLSLAIAGEVVHKGYLVLYASAPRLTATLEQQQFRTDSRSAQYREMLYGCELLVIDDLGAEFTTRFTTSAIYDIINSRLIQQRPTIINTNLAMPELRAMYSERTASRIQGGYEQIHFYGSDIRIKTKAGG